MQVKEIMTKNCTYVSPDTTFQEAAKIMRDKDLGSLPVGENDRLVGLITDRDIVVRTLANGKDINTAKVKDAMTPHCLYCFEEDTIEEASKNMGKKIEMETTVLALNFQSPFSADKINKIGKIKIT